MGQHPPKGHFPLRCVESRSLCGTMFFERRQEHSLERTRLIPPLTNLLQLATTLQQIRVTNKAEDPFPGKSTNSERLTRHHIRKRSGRIIGGLLPHRRRVGSGAEL